jgi:hypothetical protein
MCCERIMLPVAEPDLADVASSGSRADRRASVRRPARAGTRIEVRRGLQGKNPNLAGRLLDISEEGAQVTLKEPIRAWEVVELALAPAGAAQAIRGPAIICWCIPTTRGEFRAGLQLRHRLTTEEMTLLAE